MTDHEGADERALDPAQRLEHALGLAYRYLAKRDRSAWEIRHHLEVRDVDAATIDAAMEELDDQGYVDDERFAQRFAEDRRRLDGWGAERIAERLRAHGIGRAHVEAAIEQQDDQDELSAAVGALERRFAAPFPDDRTRGRALGMLVRKGYELEVAYEAIRAFERDRAA